MLGTDKDDIVQDNKLFKTRKTDRVIKAITLLVLIFMWAFVIISYPTLPKKIATHFDFNGKADDFGSKNTIWLLPILASIVSIGFDLLIRFPIQKSYLNNTDTEIATLQYHSSIRLLRIIGLIIAMMFFYITYQVIIPDTSDSPKTDVWFIPILVVSLHAPTIYLAYRFSNKVRKKTKI